jgi:hypothetical protein
MKIRTKILLILLSFAFSGCGLTVPNLRVCSVAGSMRVGAMCSTTLSREKSSMNTNEFLDFLEPQEKRLNPLKPDEYLPERAGAVCMSSDDMAKVGVFVEQACRKLGDGACDTSAKQKIEAAKAEVESIKTKAIPIAPVK